MKGSSKRSTDIKDSAERDNCNGWEVFHSTKIKLTLSQEDDGRLPPNHLYMIRTFNSVYAILQWCPNVK